MRNTKHLMKVTVAWTSIVYAVCFLEVLMFSGVRSGFMMYALHTNYTPVYEDDVLTLGTFFFGLVIWNIIAFLAVGLWVWLNKVIKD